MTGAPNPEGNWTFRRAYTYAVTVVSLGLLGWIIARMDAGDLKGVAFGLIALIALLATYYLVGPTAQAIVSALSAWKGRATP